MVARVHSPESAIARWLAHGATSRTHPVLRWAFRTYFQPLGIVADSLECEPFSALESGLGGWWLRQARWSPECFAPAHPGAADFRLLLDNPGLFAAAVDPQGLLTVCPKPGTEGDAAARRLWEAGEQGWLAARHSVRAAHDAEMFILGAAGMILDGGRAAERYAAGDDAGLCREAAALGTQPSFSTAC